MKKAPRRLRILWIENVGFSIVVLLSWLTELARIPHLLFGESFTPHWERALLRTVVVALIWAWVHFETKRLLLRLHHLEEYLLVCSWCRKIGDDGKWVSVENYFGSNFSTPTTHGMCPECERKFREQTEVLPKGT